MKHFRLCAFLVILHFLVRADSTVAAEAVEQIHALTDIRSVPVTLKDGDIISTKAAFRPPVEITIAVRVDSKNLIIGYAADQITFNWDGPEPTQLRVEGGPAAHKHKTGAGLIPTNRNAQIRWVVTNTRQQLFVDKSGRYSHDGDYSTINRPVTVSCKNSKVTVYSIKVKQL